VKRRSKTAEQKQLEENSYLLRQWRKYRREQLEQALAGPHGAVVERIVDFLRRMDLCSAPALLTLLREYDWRHVDADTRFTLLHEINQSIGALRQRSGLPVIDDALPHERATGFLLVRELLGDGGEARRSSPANSIGD
jgi:hypothetical protein